MNDRNGMTTSDDLQFWADHLPRPLGYMPPPAPPAPAPVSGPDVTAMDMQAYAAYRAQQGIETSPFIGVKPWNRASVNEREN